jgi:hypothetical protein
LSNTKTTFTLDFEGQVPVQRRSGRNNQKELLSMTQWYPKIAEFFFEGWHADPYMLENFTYVWGDFDVNITIDKRIYFGRFRLLYKTKTKLDTGMKMLVLR